MKHFCVLLVLLTQVCTVFGETTSAVAINEDTLMELFGEELLKTIRPKFFELQQTYSLNNTNPNILSFYSHEATSCNNHLKGGDVVRIQNKIFVRKISEEKKRLTQTITYITCQNRELFSEAIEVESANPLAMDQKEILNFTRKFQLQVGEDLRIYKLLDSGTGELFAMSSKRKNGVIISGLSVGADPIFSYQRSVLANGTKLVRLERYPFRVSLKIMEGYNYTFSSTSTLKLQVHDFNGNKKYFAGTDEQYSRGGFEDAIANNYLSLFANSLRKLYDSYVNHLPLSVKATVTSKLKTELEDLVQKLTTQANDPIALRRVQDQIRLYIKAVDEGMIIDNRP